jgi:FAD/FMN-containing dehydrogenase
LILADGSKVRTSAQDNPLLHGAVSGSYGSLATLVAARVRLQPAKRYVRLSYQVIHHFDEVSSAIDRLCESSPDYVDGIVLDANRTLLMTGRLTDQADGPVRCFSRPWHPWFIQHALTKVDAPSDDWIPLRDYLFRYDRAAFWMGQYCTSMRAAMRFLFSWRLQAPDIHEDISRYSRTLTPSLPLRALLGPRLSSSSLYRTLHLIPRETLVKAFHIQDFYIPTAALSTFLQHLQEHVQIYPLWLCPVKGAANDQFLSPHHLSGKGRAPKPDFVNVGVYGIPAKGRAVPDVTRELEELTHALGGRKMLYATNSIPEERFWQIYDRERYDSLREDLHACGILSDVYKRTHGW